MAPGAARVADLIRELRGLHESSGISEGFSLPQNCDTGKVSLPSILFPLLGWGEGSRVSWSPLCILRVIY